MLKRIIGGFILLMSTIPCGHVCAGEVLNQLRESVDTIITLLNAPRLQSPEMKLIRRNEVFKVVEDRFDFTEMSELSVGQFWQQMSSSQQKDFEVAFANLLESTYITKIEKYTDEKVVYESERMKSENNYYIHTEIVSGGKSIPVDYLLHKVDSQWLVYDVSIEGLSLVSNYRIQFVDAIRNGGFGNLMKVLGEKQKKVSDK